MTYSLAELKQLASTGIIFLAVYRGRINKVLRFQIDTEQEASWMKTIVLGFAADNDLDTIPLDLKCYVIEGMAPNNRSYSITVYDTHGQKLMYLEEPPRQSCHS